MHGSPLKSSVPQLPPTLPHGLQNLQLGVTTRGVEGWVELVIYLQVFLFSIDILSVRKQESRKAIS